MNELFETYNTSIPNGSQQFPFFHHSTILTLSSPTTALRWHSHSDSFITYHCSTVSFTLRLFHHPPLLSRGIHTPSFITYHCSTVAFTLRLFHHLQHSFIVTLSNTLPSHTATISQYLIVTRPTLYHHLSPLYHSHTSNTYHHNHSRLSITFHHFTIPFLLSPTRNICPIVSTRNI